MPVQLYALTWSSEERLAIDQWQQAHGDKVLVVGWSRILLEPLDKAVQDPSIFGLAIEGVVIRDHEKWPADALRETLKKLSGGMLDLYAVSNGSEPVSLPKPVQY